MSNILHVLIKCVSHCIRMSRILFQYIFVLNLDSLIGLQQVSVCALCCSAFAFEFLSEGFKALSLDGVYYIHQKAQLLFDPYVNCF